MNTVFRRLRGMCSIGALWAAIWAPVGVALAAVQLAAGGFWPLPVNLLVGVLLSGLKNGFLAGFVFSGALGLVYRKRSFGEIRPSAMGGLGALAGMLLPAGTILATVMSGYFIVRPISIVIALGFGGALGAATALGSLKLAQRAPAELSASGGAEVAALGRSPGAREPQ